MNSARSDPRISPLRKSVTVKAPPELAFRRFTAEMGSWWPLRSHSVGKEDALTVLFEGRVGGRILERLRDGRESVWGTVTLWEPPHRVGFTWHPGRDPSTRQDILVEFHPSGAGTRVNLLHSGFERLGPLARKARAGYPWGWTYVLGLYAGRRGMDMQVLHGLTRLLLAARRRRGAPAPPPPRSRPSPDPATDIRESPER